MIWWGTNYLSTYLYTGGALLRADWLALSVIGVCLMKRGRPALGGFALTYAALLRIFPFLIIAGLGLKAAMRMWRLRAFRLEPAHRAFAMGGVTAALLCSCCRSLWLAGSRRRRAGLGRVRRKQSEASFDTAHEQYGPEDGTLVFTQHALGPYRKFLARYAVGHMVRGEASRVQPARAAVLVLVVAFVAVFVRLVAEQDDWVALVLGTALVPVATELTCYYYSVFLLFALLWRKWDWSGAALCALSTVVTVDSGHLPQSR
jgi:hypothetical protein